MNLDSAQFNLLFAWVSALAGFLSGMAMGLFFQKEQWLGGYASHKRRLIRLGHISFFGLAGINLMFYLTVRTAGMSGPVISVASVAMIAGGVTMPVCCALMAWHPRTQFLFGIPVISLITGAALTLIKLTP